MMNEEEIENKYTEIVGKLIGQHLGSLKATMTDISRKMIPDIIHRLKHEMEAEVVGVNLLKDSDYDFTLKIIIKYDGWIYSLKDIEMSASND